MDEENEKNWFLHSQPGASKKYLEYIDIESERFLAELKKHADIEKSQELGNKVQSLMHGHSMSDAFIALAMAVVIGNRSFKEVNEHISFNAFTKLLFDISSAIELRKEEGHA